MRSAPSATRRKSSAYTPSGVATGRQREIELRIERGDLARVQVKVLAADHEDRRERGAAASGA
jgi:hypothetical protein